jgi:hypothetical protein
MRNKLILAVILLIGSTTELQIPKTTVEAATVQKLKDIQGHWAQKEIEALVSTGAISGYADGTFKPSETVTRAQFSKILSILMGVESNELAFSTMKGHWAASYVNGLEDAGVIVPKEYPKGYNPNVVITRLEMSKMIARGLASQNESWKATLNGLNNLEYIKVPFKDKSLIVSSDLPYVALANGSGIVNGRVDGSFDPNGLASRAESAVMLSRYLNSKGLTPATEQLINKYKGEKEKSIHTYTKSELKGWINKEEDFKRLATKYPLKDENFPIFVENNRFHLSPVEGLDYTESFNEDRVRPVQSYMEAYFNVNYNTIGNTWINNIRYYYRPYHPYVYNGVSYPLEKLPTMFSKIVQDIKNDKIISESVFITDISMYHNDQMDGIGDIKVRGTQYIRYTSGSSLPKGVTLNKWYKRDIDVEIRKPMNTNLMKWETSDWVFEKITSLSSYQEVTN